MHTNKLLSSFEYAVMPSATSVSITRAAKRFIARDTPLLQVKINFKNGEFTLRGNWQFIMAANSEAKPSWYSYHSGIVEVSANTYSEEIDLDDYDSDGIVYPVEGVIKDGSSVTFCSGLIQLDKAGDGNGMNKHDWNLSIYLCDYQDDNCEIKFNLPVHIAGCNENNN